MTRRGALTIEKILIVSNTGWVINPRAATDQVKGGVAWELSHALYGGLNMSGGKFQNVNFDNYKLMRFPDMPDVESVFAMSETDRKSTRLNSSH